MKQEENENKVTTIDQSAEASSVEAAKCPLYYVYNYK